MFRPRILHTTATRRTFEVKKRPRSTRSKTSAGGLNFGHVRTASLRLIATLSVARTRRVVAVRLRPRMLTGSRGHDAALPRDDSDQIPCTELHADRLRARAPSASTRQGMPAVAARRTSLTRSTALAAGCPRSKAASAPSTDLEGATVSWPTLTTAARKLASERHRTGHEASRQGQILLQFRHGPIDVLPGRRDATPAPLMGGSELTRDYDNRLTASHLRHDHDWRRRARIVSAAFDSIWAPSTDRRSSNESSVGAARDPTRAEQTRQRAHRGACRRTAMLSARCGEVRGNAA